MNQLIKDLSANLAGDVRFDTVSRKVYSVDASIYEVEPIAIVLPKTKHDLISAVQIAKEHRIPVIARGAATGIAGGCIGSGLIIDTSKYLNRILEINYEEEYAICEPGVVQDRLNEPLAEKGYRLGPDTSTGNRATIGGMMANNAAGARSLLYGKMVDHVLAVELVLASGEVLNFHEVDEKQKWPLKNREGYIYREIHRIRKEYRNEIANRFPHIPRRVSGYNLDELIKPQPLNVCKLITGSEGTLGIATEIKLKISKVPPRTGICVIHFHDMIEAMRTIETLLTYEPIAIEMIDDKIIESGRRSPTMLDKLDWLEGNPQTVFAVEMEVEKLKNIQKNIGYAQVVLTDPKKISHVWSVRKAGLGLLLSKRSYSRAIAFIEDITVAPENLASFMKNFQSYLKSIGKEAGIYGHVGSGCMHIRPYIDMRCQDELQLMEKIMLDTAELLLNHGGALSGEHGDGYTRSWLNRKMFGEKLYQAFVELKAAFDPENRMNPGKIVHAPPLLQNLRKAPKIKVDTFLDFSREGGFELSADLCNGNAMCRKEETLMCPSFHATRDEYDTTRARAQTLRSVVQGKIPLDDPAVLDVLDLCLECKGCKTECPSQVDMAKMKAEILYQYQQIHGYSFRNRLFGHIGSLYRLTAPLSRLVNPIQKTKLFKYFQSTIGISPKRTLPELAPQRFSSWFQQQKHRSKQVVLFIDTFTEFNAPEIGKAAVKLLNSMGYEVICPKWHCCGRPFLSKGMLKQARAQAEKVVEMLSPYKDIPIIGLEPSCILTVKDDFRDLVGQNLSVTTLDEFLYEHLDELTFTHRKKTVKVHGHCHQKALVGTTPTLNVLKAVPGFHVSEIPSGCCGMAGSFGYEKEHYDISMKIGELHLFPEIRNSPSNTLIVASGFSCRNQIAHGTQRKALHLAEILASQIS